MNKALLAGVIVTIAFSSVGCKGLKKDKDKDETTSTTSGKTSNGSSDNGSSNSDTAKVDPKQKASAGCTLPKGAIKGDVTIEKGCTVQVTENIDVKEGGVLKIEAGAKLVFASNIYVQIEDGKLVVEGTQKEPVVFTSAATTQANGDWCGIEIDGNVVSGTSINYAHIEYAGAETHGSHGAITILGQKSPKRISITNSTFSNTDQNAVYADSEKGGFAKFEGNKMKGMKVALHTPANVLSSVGTNDFGGSPIETYGDVKETATWTNFGTPIVVTDVLKIKNSGSAPVLTVAPGTTFKFAGGADIDVGDENGGGFIAPKCSFTSANASPQPGDWVGIILEQRASNVDLTGSTFEYAGAETHGGRAVITFYGGNAKDARNVKLDGVSIKNSKTAGVASGDNNCADFDTKVTVDSIPACRK